jgi:hypothetical protein
MFSAAILSLALVSGDATAFKLAQAEPPVSTGTTADAEVRAAAAAEGSPFPPGAPTDDYGFVGWCYGALSQHMALRPAVWAEVERIERQFPDPDTTPEASLAAYDVQQKNGQTELVLFEQALDAKKGDKAAAIAKGQSIWAGADTAGPRPLAQMWMSWSLPARCRTTATRMLGR